MTKKEFDALCYKQFMMALDNIQEVEPEDYATIEREEFAAVAYRVFSQGVFMGYNLGARQAVDILKEEGVVEEHTIQ